MEVTKLGGIGLLLMFVIGAAVVAVVGVSVIGSVVEVVKSVASSTRIA